MLRRENMFTGVMGLLPFFGTSRARSRDVSLPNIRRDRNLGSTLFRCGAGDDTTAAASSTKRERKKYATEIRDIFEGNRYLIKFWKTAAAPSGRGRENGPHGPGIKANYAGFSVHAKRQGELRSRTPP